LSSVAAGEGSGLFLVVSAPSGTGKTSICREVMKLFPEIRFSVSHTSRPPRPGEVDGKDYFFVSREAFETMIGRSEFVEWAENYGQLYGTSVMVLDALALDNRDVILDVDPRGAKALKTRYPDAVFVFILPPSLEELKNRLRKRGHEDEDALAVRFGNAVAEMGEVMWYDYVIFNDKLSEAIDLLRAIYLAEKNRGERRKADIEMLLFNRR
jgi:guanylate kinase